MGRTDDIAIELDRPGRWTRPAVSLSGSGLASRALERSRRRRPRRLERSDPMHVTVTGRHFEVTPALRSYLDVRLARMERYAGSIHSAHVTLSAEKHRHRAEIALRSHGKEFTGKDVSEDMFSAVDRVAEKLDKQLRRFKDRRTSARKNAGKTVVNGVGRHGTLRVLRADTVGRGPHEHELVMAGEYDIDALTVDDAIVRLENGRDAFVVFASRATDGIHVVYKLPDGNYGVLNLHAAV
jgi:putative sigma-54 modulation protein